MYNKRYKYICGKNIKNFPNKDDNFDPIPAKGDEEDIYLTDNADDIYDCDENFAYSPYDYFFQKNTKICCI